jgi:hypothetical protein
MLPVEGPPFASAAAELPQSQLALLPSAKPCVMPATGNASNEAAKIAGTTKRCVMVLSFPNRLRPKYLGQT